MSDLQLTRRVARSLGDSWASCLLQDWLHGFHGLFTDTSEHIHFLLFSVFSFFSLFQLLVACGRLSWLVFVSLSVQRWRLRTSYTRTCTASDRQLSLHPTTPRHCRSSSSRQASCTDSSRTHCRPRPRPHHPTTCTLRQHGPGTPLPSSLNSSRWPWQLATASIKPKPNLYLKS